MLSKGLKLARLLNPIMTHSYPYQLPIKKLNLVMKIVAPFASDLPKHHKLTMPALSPTMEKGNIMKYLKQEGDQISAGDVLCEVETDKATVGFEVQEDGYLAKIIIPEGSKGIDIGELVAIIVPKKDSVGAFKNYTAGSTAQETKTTPPPQPQSTPAPETQTPPPPSATQSYPKHSELGLPALSPTMEKGNLMKWLVKEGDQITEGDVICEIETDKATVGFEVQEKGFIAKILVPEGTKDIAIGTILAIVTPKKDTIQEFANFQLGGAAPKKQEAPQQQQQQQTTTSTQQQQQTISSEGGRILASPLAKQVAKEQNISLEGIKGSGIDGSIIKKDVEKAAASGTVQQATSKKPEGAKVTAPPTSAPKPASPVQAIEGNPYVDTELTNMRLTIAHRLLESKTTIPHYYLTMNINMNKLIKLREALNKVSKNKISVNDFLIKASALALRDVPQVNSQWGGTFIRKFEHADISIAVATDAGLITPIVFNAGAKGLQQIAANSKEIAEKAKANKLKPKEFIGGTFTISNLGMFGIDQFIAVINPPQAAILAVGKTSKVLVPTDVEGQNEIQNQMSVTLSCDHRVVDGAVGAQWLQRLKLYLEEPNLMLL